jgi:putative membrane protein
VALTLSAAGAYAQGGASAQGGSSAQGGQSQPSGRSQSRQGGDTRSKQFVEKMMMANMAEVQLGQMGVQQATSADVKSFAQMMVTDHTQANQELMPLAQQLGVQQPAVLDAKHRAVADRLAKLQGAEFDRQFMRAMVAAHQDVMRQTQPIAGAQRGAMSGSHGGSATVGTSGTAGGGTMSGTAGSSGTTGAGSASSGSTGSTGSTGSSGSGSGGSSSTSGSGSSTGAGSSSTGMSSGAGGAGPSSAAEYAAKTLPIVQQHLQHAQQIAQTINK